MILRASHHDKKKNVPYHVIDDVKQLKKEEWSVLIPLPYLPSSCLPSALGLAPAAFLRLPVSDLPVPSFMPASPVLPGP